MNRFNLIVDDEVVYVWDGREDLRKNTRITCVRMDDTVTVIPRYAFEGCINLREVQLPSGLIRLEDGCFSNCKSLMKSILLPNSVQDIVGRFIEAFGNTGPEGMKISSRVRAIPNAAFFGCESLADVELHENMQWIGEWSFARCTLLKTIQFPSSLRWIHLCAFVDCGLEQIILPPNVSVHGRAFENCKQLIEIILPQSVGRIEANAFCGCCNISILQLLPTTTRDTKFTAPEQKLIAELCRTDGKSSLDRLGIEQQWMEQRRRFEKDSNSTVRMTCLFTFLKRNDDLILKLARQDQVGARKMT